MEEMHPSHAIPSRRNLRDGNRPFSSNSHSQADRQSVSEIRICFWVTETQWQRVLNARSIEPTNNHNKNKMLRVNCFLIDANFLCQLATNTLLSPHLAPHPSSRPIAGNSQPYNICSNNNNFPNLFAELQISLFRRDVADDHQSV